MPYSVCDTCYQHVQSFNHFQYFHLKKGNASLDSLNDCACLVAFYSMCVDTVQCRYVASVLMAFTLCALRQHVRHVPRAANIFQ